MKLVGSSIFKMDGYDEMEPHTYTLTTHQQQYDTLVLARHLKVDLSLHHQSAPFVPFLCQISRFGHLSSDILDDKYDNISRKPGNRVT